MIGPTHRGVFGFVWRVPVALAILTIFGPLAALLGTGVWHALSWLAMSVPIIVCAMKLWRPHGD